MALTGGDTSILSEDDPPLLSRFEVENGQGRRKPNGRLGEYTSYNGEFDGETDNGGDDNGNEEGESEEENDRKERIARQSLIMMCVIGSWNTGALMVLFPSVIGVFGFVGGPLITVAIQTLSNLSALNVLNHYYFYRSIGEPIGTFSELGHRLGGRKLKETFRVLQVITQIAFLPTFITLVTHSLQHMFWDTVWLQCNAAAGGVSFTLVLVLSFCVAEWEHFEWLFVVSLGMLLALLGVFAYLGFVQDGAFGGPTQPVVGMDFPLFDECYENVTVNLTLAPTVRPTVSPSYEGVWANTSDVANFTASPTATQYEHVTLRLQERCEEPAELYGPKSVINALSVIMFSYTPNLFLVEILAYLDLNAPFPKRSAKIGLELGFWFSTFSCLIVGLILAIQWGNQVPDLVSSVLHPSTWESIFVNCILFVTACNVIVVDLLVLNYVFFHHRIRQSSGVVYFLKRMVTVVVPCLLAFLLTILLPRMTWFITLVNATGLIWIQYILPSVFSLPSVAQHMNGRGHDGSLLYEQYAMSRGTQGILGSIAALSAIFAVVELVSLGHDLSSLNFSGDYWCNMVLK